MYFRGRSPRKYMKARGRYNPRHCINYDTADLYPHLAPRNSKISLCSTSTKGFSMQNMGNVPTHGAFEFPLI